MKKILSILLIILFGAFITNVLVSKKAPWVKIDGKTFIVDLAKTDEQKAKGLSIYDKLPLDKGMIFIYKKAGYYAFWMKDMKFPIDIIYINKNKIVDIFKNVPIKKSENETLAIVRPKAKADTILEINAGLSDKYNFKTGDFVKINPAP